MPSTKFKNKQRSTEARSDQARPGQSYSCHMKYDFDASCLTAANAAKIEAAFAEIAFRVDTTQQGEAVLHLDEQKWGYRYATPDFKPICAGEKREFDMGLLSAGALHAIMEDVGQISDNLIDLLFAATHHDPHWLATPEAQQVAGAFSASLFIRHRICDRLDEVASTMKTSTKATSAARSVK